MSDLNEYEDYLHALPPDWQVSSISEISTVVGGGTPSRDVIQYWNGDIPWATPGELTREKSMYIGETRENISAEGLRSSGAALLPRGSLMITTRATLGARAINRSPMTTNQGFKSLVFKDPNAAVFYYYLVDRLKPELIRRSSGTTFLEVSGGEVGKIRVPAPPLRERNLIVEVCVALDATICETNAIIEKLKCLKNGLLHDLLTRGIDASGEMRQPRNRAPHLYKDSLLGWIPLEWSCDKVKAFGQVQLGRQRSPEHEKGRNLRPYLRVANVQDGTIDFSDVLQMNFTPSEQTIFSVLNGDIFLNEGQSLDLVGRCAIYEAENNLYCFQNSLIRFRCGKLLIPKFARAVFKSWLDTGVFTRYAKQTTSMAHLGADRFANIPFPLPSREEQEKIINSLQAIDDRILSEQSIALKLCKKKIGLIEDLLTGRVRFSRLLSPSRAEI